MTMWNTTSPPSTHLHSNDNSWVQCATTAGVIFVLGLSGMYLATLLTSRGSLVSLGNMCSCGVLLAAALIHTIPTGDKILSPLSPYPFSGLLVGATFILLLLIEEFVHMGTHHDHDHQDQHQDQDQDQNHQSQSLHRSLLNKSSEQPCGHHHGHGHGQRSTTIPSSPLPTNTTHGHGHGHGHRHTSLPLAKQNVRTAPSAAATHTHHNHLEQHLKGSIIAGLMLFITLDIHSIFAGMSVGVNLKDSSLLVALCVHKFSAAFALGSTFCTIQIPPRQFGLIAVVFSLTTPLGVVIGAVLSNTEQTNSIMFGVVYSVVGGTFLYIGILELGMKELLVCRDDPHGSGLHVSLEMGKLGALVFGYSVMAVLAVWL